MYVGISTEALCIQLPIFDISRLYPTPFLYAARSFTSTEKKLLKDLQQFHISAEIMQHF
jgi:hypothetical protein